MTKKKKKQSIPSQSTINNKKKHSFLERRGLVFKCANIREGCQWHNDSVMITIETEERSWIHFRTRPSHKGFGNDFISDFFPSIHPWIHPSIHPLDSPLFHLSGRASFFIYFGAPLRRLNGVVIYLSWKTSSMLNRSFLFSLRWRVSIINPSPPPLYRILRIISLRW